MGEAQPSQIKIPEAEYIRILESKLSQARTLADQQEAVILGLMAEVQEAKADAEQYAESLRQTWEENEEKEDASSDTG